MTELGDGHAWRLVVPYTDDYSLECVRCGDRTTDGAIKRGVTFAHCRGANHNTPPADVPPLAKPGLRGRLR